MIQIIPINRNLCRVSFGPCADTVIGVIWFSIMMSMLTGCQGFAPRADPGTVKIDHIKYDNQGEIKSRTKVDARNDQDSKEGFDVTMTRDGDVGAGTSGSKDAVQAEGSNGALWFFGGITLIIIGLASVFGKTLSRFIPGLWVLPRGPSWAIVAGGIGCICVPYMNEVVGFLVICGILAGAYFLSVQHNVQAKDRFAKPGEETETPKGK